MKELIESHLEIIQSYLRSAVGAGLAVVLAGNHDVRAIVSAACAAVLPPLLRWLNPNDSAFGRTK